MALFTSSRFGGPRLAVAFEGVPTHARDRRPPPLALRGRQEPGRALSLRGGVGKTAGKGRKRSEGRLGANRAAGQLRGETPNGRSRRPAVAVEQPPPRGRRRGGGARGTGRAALR